MKLCPHAVIFDFDYTLGDSSGPAIDCVNFALGRMGLPAATDEAIRRTIGLSLPDTLRTLTGEQYASRSQEFSYLFVERAEKVMQNGTSVFEMVPGVLRALSRRRIALGIVSSKYRYRIEGILKREGLLPFFDTIVGGEDVLVHKPDPTSLIKAIKQLDVVPSTTLYVGDSVTDAETAVRAGVPFVAVLSGVTPEADFRGYSPVHILESVAGLPDLVRTDEVNR